MVKITGTLILITTTIIGVFTVPTQLNGKASVVSKLYVESSIVKAANKVGIPSELLRAICVAESRLTPDAFVFADGGGTNHAFGMCQVLLNTAKNYGFRDSRCLEDFTNLEKSYKTCKLFGPYTNALYAAKYLKYQLKRYDSSWISAIASYNTGSLKICKTGWVYRIKGGKKEKLYKCKKGGLLNQKYVDRVLESLIKEGGKDESQNKEITP